MEIKEVVVHLQDLQNSSDHAKAEYSYDLLFIQNVSYKMTHTNPSKFDSVQNIRNQVKF